MKLEEAIVASLEKIADALGVEVAELFRPSDNAKIICPHCGKAIILKAEKELGSLMFCASISYEIITLL